MDTPCYSYFYIEKTQYREGILQFCGPSYLAAKILVAFTWFFMVLTFLQVPHMCLMEYKSAPFKKRIVADSLSHTQHTFSRFQGIPAKS